MVQTAVTINMIIGEGQDIHISASNDFDIRASVEDAWFEEMSRMPALLLEAIRNGGWPVRTGASLRGFYLTEHIDAREAIFDCMNTEDYAVFVEHGTRYMDARQVVQREWEALANRYGEEIAENMVDRIQRDADRHDKRQVARRAAESAGDAARATGEGYVAGRAFRSIGRPNPFN